MALLLSLAATAVACQVPVFRYAFEQWNPEQYRVLILAGEQRSEFQAMAKELGSSEKGKNSALNVQVDVMSPDSNPIAARLWKEHNVNGKPIAVTLYPERARGIGGSVAHVTTASRDNLQAIFDSPVRREIAKRLGQGESAVWVLLECGNEKKDAAARENLEKQLAEDAKWLELPTPEEMEVKPEVLEAVKVKLRVGFSLIRLRADDPEEQFLVDMLLSSESDLRDFDEPIAFPVFGRGLVLYALVGKGIAPDTIRGASKFICGPCSCQVKEQNPGFDMLLKNEWEQAIGEVKISSPLPTVDATPELIPIPSGRSKRK
ncbi:MAG TPA: hypothetical protein DDW52_01660 [Planctomycetaceae bacterium]|nr:hypothetical protein [Planctomycetaceae bacterium]